MSACPRRASRACRRFRRSSGRGSCSKARGSSSMRRRQHSRRMSPQLRCPVQFRAGARRMRVAADAATTAIPTARLTSTLHRPNRTRHQRMHRRLRLRRCPHDLFFRRRTRRSRLSLRGWSLLRWRAARRASLHGAPHSTAPAHSNTSALQAGRAPLFDLATLLKLGSWVAWAADHRLGSPRRGHRRAVRLVSAMRAAPLITLGLPTEPRSLAGKPRFSTCFQSLREGGGREGPRAFRTPPPPATWPAAPAHRRPPPTSEARRVGEERKAASPCTG